MKSIIKIERTKENNSLSIYVGSKNRVNDMMFQLMEAGFTVCQEPHFIDGGYEGCFLCEDNLLIKICYKENSATFQKVPSASNER